MEYKKTNNKKQIIMKVIMIYICICIIGVVFNEIGKNNGNKKSKTNEDSKNCFEYLDCNIKFLEGKVKENNRGDKCLYVYFEFTNNSDENQSFDYLVDCQAFQNGIEVETNYIYDCDEERNGSKEIQPGASITVAEVFEIGDNTQNVILEIRPFSIWSDRLLFEKEIQIVE